VGDIEAVARENRDSILSDIMTSESVTLTQQTRRTLCLFGELPEADSIAVQVTEAGCGMSRSAIDSITNA
jgi:hypothetical protein